nr:hypothetical protein [uncultured Blautia sp.]
MKPEEKKEIMDKINELLELCQYRNAPMFVTVVLSDDGEQTEYYNRMHSAKAHNIQLSNDQIAKHILIANGFAAVPPRESVEIDTESLYQGMDKEES